MNLVVGDYLKLKIPDIQVIDEALEVVKWFNNHSRALGMLRTELRTHEKPELGLILPVATRWTSHYLSCSRLLKLEQALRSLTIYHSSKLELCAGERADMRRKACQILNTINSQVFWQRLRMYVQILHCICIY